MGFRAFAFTYLVGGVTFLPLVLLVVCGVAWVLSPRIDGKTQNGPKSDAIPSEQDPGRLEDKEARSRNQSLTGDAAASGTFAVLRRYDFQAATTALNAKSSANGATGSSTTLDGTVTGDHGFNSSSESVYQSMYRSVFDRNKNTSATNALLEHEDGSHQPNTKAGKRKPTSANVLYIVLRHGHLMIYDSPAQIEVKHVIGLAHHTISLQAGEGVEELEDEKKMVESDLFLKRTAIVLSPLNLPYGSQQSGPKTPLKPFFLFSSSNIDREDFYHALLATRSHPPIPQALATDALIKLQSNLHSVSLTQETRAINALVGRIFLALHSTTELTDIFRSKIEKKLSRIQKPSFIPTLLVQSIDVGDASPVFTNPRLRDLNISGDLTISADVRYNGGLSITLLAVAKLDLGSRFKARTVDLVLKISIQRIQGTMLLRMKPPPSNRIWSCFEIMPDMEIRVEPVVSDRKITYGFILRTIEDRLRIAIAEGFVKPNWDDTPLPLVDTQGSSARGGIWADEGREETPISRRSSELGNSFKRHERTQSMPILGGERVDEAQSSAVDALTADMTTPRLKHMSSIPTEDSQLKRRPIPSTPTQVSSSNSEIRQSPPTFPRPLRSPSLTTPVPSVAVDGQHVEHVRSDDASLRHMSTQPRRTWRSRGSDSSQQPKDALEELRVVRDRAEQALARPPEVAVISARLAGLKGEPEPGEDPSLSEDQAFSDAASISSTSKPGSFTLGRTNSDRSITESIVSSRSQQSQQRKQTILAATAAATSAARNWGWNAIQRNKDALPRGLGRKDPQQQPTFGEPMGRGQPLPPPGVPLPGPQKSGWAAMGNLRRKPVPPLPPRRFTDSEPSSSDLAPHDTDKEEMNNSSSQEEHNNAEAEDEFGPWRENSGFDMPMDHKIQQQSDHQTLDGYKDPLQLSRETDFIDPHRTAGVEDTLPSANSREEASRKPRKAPPPLPARRPVPMTSVNEEVLSDLQDPAVPEVSEPKAEDNQSESGIPIPEAEAEAVAAENATPALAQGVTDDASVVDTDDGDTIVIESAQHALPQEEQSPVSSLHDFPPVGGDGLNRVDTQEKFAQGQNLGEEDFEREEARHENSDRDLATDSK